MRRNEDIVGEFHYKSASTDVFSMGAGARAGRSFVSSSAKYGNKLAPISGNITVDLDSYGWASGGMSAALRDLVRFEVMALNLGAVGDRGIPVEPF